MMLEHLRSIGSKRLFTLWWTIRWTRYAVLFLIPVAVLDVIFTLFGVWQYGVAVEMNPVGRWLMSADLWIPWIALNIGGFMAFCMFAFSYYLHSRSMIGGPDTTFLAFLISLRVGMATYNMAYYYIVSVAAGYPPLWLSLVATGISFFILNVLLHLEHDLSWRRTIASIKTRIDGLKDRRIIRSVGGIDEKSDISASSPLLSENGRRIWLKRSGFIALSLIGFYMTLLVLELFVYLAGLSEWLRDLGQTLVISDQEMALWFMLTLFAVMIFVGLSVASIAKAFEVQEP